MLTLFAVPKPAVGPTAVVQRNAVHSWAQLASTCEILLLGDSPGTAELAAEVGARHIPGVRSTDQGTPRLDDVFAQAERHASHDVICYVNADIILLPEFCAAVKAAATRWPNFLLCGQRTDLPVDECLDFAPGWDAALRERVAREGASSGPAAVDYFAFRRGLWPAIPPFALGRTAWDNWLLYGARIAGVPLVDATARVTCVHQMHAYHHIADGEREVWAGTEARRNFALTDDGRSAYVLDDATWLFTRWGFVPALTPRHLARRWRHARRHHPRLLALRAVMGRWPVLRRWGLPASATEPVPIGALESRT